MKRKESLVILVVIMLFFAICACERKEKNEKGTKGDIFSITNTLTWEGTYQYKKLICPGREFIVGPRVLEYEVIYYQGATYEVSEKETYFCCETRAEEDGFVEGRFRYEHDFEEKILDEEFAEELDYGFLKFRDTEFDKVAADFEDAEEEAAKLFSDPDFEIKDWVGSRIRLYPSDKKTNHLSECWIDAGNGKVFTL